MRRQVSAVGLSLLFAAQASGQVLDGPEIHVTAAYTTAVQFRPSVAADAAGNFVVVWDSYGQDDPSNPNRTGVFGQRFDASGAALGTEFQVNAYTTDHQRDSEIASDPAGGFVVVWSSYEAYSLPRVRGRRFDAMGIPGPEFEVSTSTSGASNRPDVAVDGVGNFVVVWQAAQIGGTSSEIFGRRYDAAGAPMGPPFPVNTIPFAANEDPSIDRDADGNFVVVWSSWERNGDNLLRIRGQRFDPAGTPVGGELTLSAAMATSGGVHPSVAITVDGNFVVAWKGHGYSTDPLGIVGQRYDAEGAPAGGLFRVNSYTSYSQADPVVSADDSGSFVVAWQSASQDGNGYGVFAQAFDARGARAGSEFQLNAYTTWHQFAPTIAAQGPGRFVSAWVDYLQEPVGNPGVFARRFRSDLIFRDGFETGTLSAWSGSSTDGSDAFVSGAAGMGATTRGLIGLIDDTAGIYVQDDTPQDEERYRARFYLNAENFDPGEAQGHLRTRMFLVFSESPNRRVAALVLRRQGGLFSVLARARQDDDTQADTAFFPIGNGPHAIEIDLVRATDADAADGRLELFVDGVSQQTLTGLDNSFAEVDFVRMGALSLKAGANGLLLWDEFESRRASYIGTLP